VNYLCYNIDRDCVTQQLRFILHDKDFNLCNGNNMWCILCILCGDEFCLLPGVITPMCVSHKFEGIFAYLRLLKKYVQILDF
jgi:hypothetical protein